MKKTIIAAAVLVALTACNKSLIETPALEGDYGYITFDVSADTEMIETKAQVSQETLKNYKVKLMQVVGDGSQEITQDKSTPAISIPSTYEGFIDKSFKLSAGTYYIVAENNTANESHPSNSKGSKHISGRSENVELAAGATQTLSATCSVINTAVTVDLDADFMNTFTNPSIVISDSAERSYTFVNEDYSHEEKNQVYFPSNVSEVDNETTKYYTTLTLKVTATVAGESKYYSLDRKVYRANWNKITLAAGENGTINVTITADDSLTPQDEETITIDPTTGTETPEE